ncbi:MAG: hypothetical protein GXP21_07050 [Gammaproteobacteria bacterium]|nr:hypothetical protein [Gammaproteobacteria bacterium]
MNDIVIRFISVKKLISKDIWESFFIDLENCIGKKITHLDVNDTLKNKFIDAENAAEYVCDFGEKESSRRLFGKFSNTGIRFNINIFREGSRFPNSISVMFEKKILKKESCIETILNIFRIGNSLFSPFYSYADTTIHVSEKRKATGMTVDLEAELIGMFWLTYFNQKYVKFFGNEKIDKASGSISNGANFKFGSSPTEQEVVLLRNNAEKVLGEKSFVDPKLPFDKPKGRHAILYQSLKIEEVG